MTDKPHIIERAYQIARLGKCNSLDDIERTLTGEGYDGVHQHMAGTTIRKTLRDLMAESRRQARANR